ncbi:MAG TPA: hypothetical protein ENI27_09900 [bacterium]|nr:hypothetical protein [bacterium]
MTINQSSSLAHHSAKQGQERHVFKPSFHSPARHGFSPLFTGSGLQDGKHVASEDGTAWTTLGTYGRKDFALYIVYDLGSVHNVQAMHIWNYNSALPLVRIRNNEEASKQKPQPHSVIGAKDVEILTSLDGKTFQSRGVKQFQMASGASEEKGQRIKTNYENVRFIKFVIQTTHEGTIFNGKGDKPGDFEDRMLTGLSEVQFIAPGLIELKTPGDRLTLKEGSGKSTNYQIRLLKKPSESIKFAAVPEGRSLALNAGKAGEALFLDFNAKNWNQWQNIEVKAVDDDRDTTDLVVSIAHFFKPEKRQGFSKVSQTLEVSIEDNDETPIEDLKPIDPDKRMEWFRDIKYYWFICWGPCAIGGGEISFSRANYIGSARYDQFYKEFKGEKFDAEEWVKLAKAGGLKTIVLIAKHCDGFAMWDTETTDYDIMSTPFGRDMTKELAEACKKHGLRFSLYYSNPDWYNPDWWCAVTGPGYELKPEEYGTDNYEFSSWWGRAHIPEGQKPNKQRYVKYMTKQCEELLNNYGDISLMWWDGANPGCFGQIWVNEQETIGRDLEKLARKWQPAMVQNNRLGWDRTTPGYPGGWFSDAFGDYNSTEIGMATVNVNKPWELTWTLGTQWSWKPNDIYKTKKNQIREYLLKAVGQNGNYLMDVSPDSSGAFEPRVVKRITEIGNWLKLYGESIYETRGGPYMPQDPNAATWGYSTRKDNKVYLHILNWPADNQLTLPSLGKRIVKSKLLTGGNVNVTQANATSPITIEAPSYYQKEIDTIIELEFDSDVMKITPIRTKGDPGSGKNS